MAYIGALPAETYTALTQQTFSSPTGTSFTLSQSCTNSQDIALFIDNVRQNPDSYSVSGTALTTSTISSPSTMYCIFNGRTTETVNPPDDSVGLSQMASATDGNLITFDASGNPAYVSTGSDGQVLTSSGAGQPCAFETLSAGKVLQVVNTQTGAHASATGTFPNDDTIPQITEGSQFLSLAITPASTSNKLLVEVVAYLTNGTAASQLICAIFNTDVHSSNAGAVGMAYPGGTGTWKPGPLVMQYYLTAPSTSATTFTLRVGSHQASTTAINSGIGQGTARKFGGAFMSEMTITEISA